jgi:di/tripeptidase
VSGVCILSSLQLIGFYSIQVNFLTYETHFCKKPNLASCHARLECGILRQNYLVMGRISFGRVIKGTH